MKSFVDTHNEGNNLEKQLSISCNLCPEKDIQSMGSICVEQDLQLNLPTSFNTDRNSLLEVSHEISSSTHSIIKQKPKNCVFNEIFPKSQQVIQHSHSKDLQGTIDKAGS